MTISRAAVRVNESETSVGQNATPAKAMLDGIERHLDRRLINQAIDAARRRGLITAEQIAVLEGAR